MQAEYVENLLKLKACKPLQSQLAVLRHDRGSSEAEVKKLNQKLCKIEMSKGIQPGQRWTREQPAFVEAQRELKHYKMHR